MAHTRARLISGSHIGSDACCPRVADYSWRGAPVNLSGRPAIDMTRPGRYAGSNTAFVVCPLPAQQSVFSRDNMHERRPESHNRLFANFGD